MEDEEDSPGTSSRRQSSKTTSNAITVRCAEQMLLSAMMQDVDILFRRFSEKGGLSFYDFTEIYLDMEFPTIFLGRYSIPEMVEFSEFLLSYASAFIFTIRDEEEKPSFLTAVTLTDTKKLDTARRNRPLKERIFGVYLTYSLYFTQPQENIANIKLSVGQMKELLAFCQRELLSEQRNEALFCINRLIDQHAFMVLPFERQFNPMLARKTNVATSDTIDISESMTDDISLPALRNIENDFTLLQTDMLHKRYLEEKKRHKLLEMHTVTDSLMTTISKIITVAEEELKSEK